MSVIYENAIVEKRNVLNELRSNNMTLQELRFFSIYLSKIDPWDKSTRCVRFPLEDFKRIMDYDKLNIAQLKASTDSLLTKIVHVPTESGGYDSFQLFKRCRVDKDSEGWYVAIDVHDEAVDLMFDFKKEYFKYKLWNALRLKSANQIRMYEILKQYQNTKSKSRELTVEELKALLGISSKEYSGRTGWSDFKKYVLDSCQKALAELTDIYYTYEKGKGGRGGKWLSIIFHIYENKNYTDPLTIGSFIDNQKEILLDVNDESDQLSLLEKSFTSACDNEFSEEEMEVILDYVNQKQLPEEEKYDYIKKMHTKMNAYASKNKITSRFSYLCTMIRNDKIEETDTDKYKEFINRF